MQLFKNILFLIFFCSFYTFAQISDPDVSFKDARELYFGGKKVEGEQLLKEILVKYPTYGDVRLFLANTYSWQDKYDKARKEYETLLEQNEKNKDYWVGIIKNELYDDKSIDAMTRVFQGLNVFPDDSTLTIEKARVQNYQLKPFKALKTIKDYLKKYPDCQEVKDYLSSLRGDMLINSLSYRFTYEHFSDVYDPMIYNTLQYGRETSKGSVVARLNYFNKFDTWGSQIELDAYPSIADGFYAYLNIGYSQSSIFPDWRYGAQLYKSLPKSYEVSLGIRSLNFDGDYINIYTGSIGKYFGNSYIFLVPYLVPDDEGTSKSLTATYRKYRDNEDQYFAVALSSGFSPEYNRFGNDRLTKEVINLKAQSFTLTNNFKIKQNKHLMGSSLSVTHQESIFDPGQYIWIISAGLSYSFSY